MKRLHIHIKTRSLDKSIAYYSALFGKTPDRIEADYAKWLLDDPAANIAVSSRNPSAEGVDHLGISFDNDEDLEALAERMKSAGEQLTPEKATTCCYAQSNKYWTGDQNGAVWELFHSFGDADHYGADLGATETVKTDAGGACCGAN